MAIRKHYVHQMEKFTEFFGGYEENTLLLAPVKQNNLLFLDPEKVNVRDQVNLLFSTKTGNPFIKLKYWVKEEICDLNSILEAIAMKEYMDSKLAKTQQKKKSCQSNLENLNKGKKNLTNFWKS